TLNMVAPADLHALRLTINWDPENQEIEGVDIGTAGGHVDYYEISPGKMTVLWEAGTGNAMRIQPEETLLRLAVKTTEESGNLSLSPLDHDNIALDAGMRTLAISASGQVTNIEKMDGFALLQN